MKIVITARELMDRGVWAKACGLTRISFWAVSEGQMDTADEVTLTEDQAARLGLQLRPADPDPAAPGAGTCRHCGQPVLMLGGDWTDEDGTTNCMSNMTAIYAPHEPKEQDR